MNHYMSVPRQTEDSVVAQDVPTCYSFSAQDSAVTEMASPASGAGLRDHAPT
jgi:hypothetical protein